MQNISASMTRTVAAPTALPALAVHVLPVSAFQPLVTDDTGTQGGGNQIELSINERRTRTGGATERLRSCPAAFAAGAVQYRRHQIRSLT